MKIDLITCSSCSNILTDAEEHCTKGLCWECCEEKHLLEKIECDENKCFLHQREVCRAALTDKPIIEEGV